MIAHDRWIAENTASNHQRLNGNTCQQSDDHQRSSAIVSDYMEILFSDPAIVGDCERSYASVIPAIMSDHMEARLKIQEGRLVTVHNVRTST